MRKWISIFCILFLFFGFVPISEATSSFNDVKNTHRFINEITFLTNKNIITGFPDDSFRPSQSVTRAQAAIMIGRAVGLNGTQRETTFKDVGSSVIASGYIDSAVSRGIIQGFPDHTYRPNDPVTRGQMAIFLSRAYGLQEETNVSFSDITPSMAAYTHVKRILAEGITNGYPNGTFKPNNPISRADFSAFMARAIDDSFKNMDKNVNELAAHFIDVGQGDSSLIVTPSGKTILIDGGRITAGEKVVSYLKKAGITSIDLLVATHPDADHIGGLLDVLSEFPVKKVLDSGAQHTTDTYLDYLTLIRQKNILFEVAKEGSTIPLDNDIQITVLNSGNGSDDLNASSIVLKITFGQINFLYTGDADVGQEYEMATNYNVEAEILKVGHHGSNTSSSQLFINEVKPKVSILSYGADNSYGHPTSEVVNRLKAAGSNLYSTAISGDIIVKTDGKIYQVSTQPWVSGTAPIVTNPTPPNPTPKPAPSTTTYSIDLVSVNRDTEVVTIKNIGKNNTDMSGWRLVSVDGNQTFYFPSGYILKAGATVYIKSGSKAVHNPPTTLKWTGAYMWDNTAKDAAEIYNPTGGLVDAIR
ncbi:MAG TPA: S-layer homology domain-containing protein [Pseudoneobacillus sp.]|nr:S-layer homology domain-containing protein [Pseudoneobacillus sp.]